MKFSEFARKDRALGGHAFVFVCGDDLLVGESLPVWGRLFASDAGGEWGFERLSAREFEALDGAELLEAALSPPLFGPSRALVVSPADKVTRKRMAVAEEIAGLPTSSLKIVFVASSRRALPRGAKLPVIEIDPVRSGDAVRWLRQRFGLEPEVAQYLVETVGLDLNALARETEKLTTYVRQERAVAVSDVDLLTLGTDQFSPFDLDDAVLDQDYPKAVRVASAMMEEGVEPLVLLFRVARTWRQLLGGKTAARRADPREVAAAVGIPQWKAARFRASCERVAWPRLLGGFRELVAADRRFKTTGANPNLVLALLLWKLAGAREPGASGGRRGTTS